MADKKEVINLAGVAPPPGPFSHVVKSGNLLFITSQLSCDLKSNKIIPGDIASQTKCAMDNLKFLLESSGAKMGDVVKTTIYLKDVKDFDKMNEVYRNYFTKGQEPARATVQAPSPIKGIDIEIEAVAVLAK